jgi:hypothetical protein
VTWCREYGERIGNGKSFTHLFFLKIQLKAYLQPKSIQPRLREGVSLELQKIGWYFLQA